MHNNTNKIGKMCNFEDTINLVMKKQSSVEDLDTEIKKILVDFIKPLKLNVDYGEEILLNFNDYINTLTKDGDEKSLQDKMGLYGDKEIINYLDNESEKIITTVIEPYYVVVYYFTYFNMNGELYIDMEFYIMISLEGTVKYIWRPNCDSLVFTSDTTASEIVNEINRIYPTIKVSEIQNY